MWATVPNTFNVHAESSAMGPGYFSKDAYGNVATCPMSLYFSYVPAS